MKLHDNWPYLLRKSWSVRWIIVAGLLAGAEVILPMFGDSIPRNWFAALMFVATMGALWARLLVQPKDGI